MKEREYQISRLAELAGVTVRTLRYYDEIGLLNPARRTDSGYRVYGETEVLRFQQILLYRSLGLPLDEIAKLMNDEDFDSRESLRRQRDKLKAEILRSENMLVAIDGMLAQMDGVKMMNVEESFAAFNEEAEARWGHSAVFQESAKRTASYSEQDWEVIHEENSQVLGALAQAMNEGSEPGEIGELVEGHRLHIERWYYPCSREMHRKLADLYESDPRFAENIDKHGAGLTEYLIEAIRT